MKPLTFLRTLLWPSRCVICDKVTEGSVTLCADCEKYLFHPAEKGAKCSVCFMSKSSCSCARCLYYDKLSAPFYASMAAKRSVYGLKFSMRLDRIPVFAEYMLEALRERELLGDVDVITYIPMHPADRFRRTYDQAQKLAEALSEKSGIPCRKLLYKYTHSKPQHTFSALGRRGNILGIFEPEKDAEAFFAGKTVLIADDILTTGNTFNEAAKTLKIFGAEKVYCTSVIVSGKQKKS